MLRGLYEKFPEQVEAWCADVFEITRKTVALLADELKGNKKPAPNAGEGQQGGEQSGNGETSKFVHEQIPGGAGEGAGQNDGSNTVEAEAGKFGHDQISNDKTGQRDDDSGPGETESGATVTTLPYHNPDIEKEDKGPTITDPNKIKKP